VSALVRASNVADGGHHCWCDVAIVERTLVHRSQHRLEPLVNSLARRLKIIQI